ncbi:MAG: APC family permease [Bacteroidia bacterium]
MNKTLFRRKSVKQILSDLAKDDLKEHKLKKSLRLRDLTALGIAAIIGAGIFSTIGNASADGGPAVVFLFIFIAFACSFSAMCYAEFASSIPVSGSAYTYAYASFGELVAWIIGWALIVEYAIGNIVVAISWSDYFTGLLDGLNVHIPEYLSMDYLSARRIFSEVQQLISSGTKFDLLTHAQQEAFLAWQNAPEFFGMKLVLDLPALAIVLAITVLIYRGVHETKTASNIFVGLKLIVIAMVIVVGAFYVNPKNWSPFSPNGMEGVLRGVASVFFAYIGFDALATTAEECHDPKKDLPRAMILSLVICSVLYILIALTLTGMISYKELAIGDPLAFVFEKLHVSWMSGIVAVSAVIAMASVLLVFQMGQPRIWMSMSRDGLLPKKFSAIHHKFKTPWFSTIITGIMVSVPALFMNLKEVTDLSSIGTLFAFIVVCAGVIRMENHKNEYHVGFRVPYFNGKFIVPLLFVSCIIALYLTRTEKFISFFSFTDFSNDFRLWSFLILSFFISVFTFIKKYSLLPVMGLLCNFYLMSQLGKSNWIWFGIWLCIGLCIYFLYGRTHSKLHVKNTKH